MFLPHLYRILLGSPANGLLAFALRREISAVRRIGEGEFEDLLTTQQAKGRITIEADEDFGDRRVKLTEAGREAAQRIV